MEKYNTYSTEDFLSDADFIRWIKESAEEERQQWEEWQERLPESLKAYQQASLILRTVLTAKRIEPAKDFGSGHPFLSFKDVFYNFFVPPKPIL